MQPLFLHARADNPLFSLSTAAPVLDAATAPLAADAARAAVMCIFAAKLTAQHRHSSFSFTSLHLTAYTPPGVPYLKNALKRPVNFIRAKGISDLKIRLNTILLAFLVTPYTKN